MTQKPAKRLPRRQESPSSVQGTMGEEAEHHTRAENRALRQRSMRLLGSLLHPVRWQVAEVAAATVFGTAAKVSVPALVGLGVDAGFRALDTGSWSRFVVIAVAALVAALLAGLLEGHAKAVTPKFAQALVLELRRRLFQHAQRLSIAFHEKYTSGRLISRQTSDVEAIREFVASGISSFVSSLLFLFGTVIALMLLDVPSGLILLAGLVPTVLFGWWFVTESRNRFRRVRVASSSMIGSFVESMVGIRAVQAFRAEDARRQQFGARADEYRTSNASVIFVFGIANTVIVALAGIVSAVLMFYDGSRVLAGTLPVGVLLSAVLYARQFFDPVTEIMMFANQLQGATSALEKISGVLEERPTLSDPAVPVPVHGAKGHIEVDGVTFSYGEGAPVLPRIDLEIPAGQVVALVGETGAGKTTLVKLIARTVDPQQGTVRIDGTDLRDITDADLRKLIVTVTQDAYLFSGTVADNIAIGRPGASREDIEAAAINVGADGFIRALPDGYDTDVRSRGGRLSAGQRQLVSFARAFLADPQVLILDEATSSLDLPSERLVQRGLQTLLKGRTAIIIAHRLSTVAIAHRVLVMVDGRIVEDGNPATLIEEATGHFAALHGQWETSLGA
ncbi:ABC transporter ATP-binding protein/permease [Tessaracoccus sp. OS52]|uniref:ABC transporter ATP-binding protein n=1 Tax=Tessaracoccus sp. OS52 TaxID=2886691 RepID=UPI001D123AAE|nr:ABC transporter ATP-binding protein [Tessaracoccus sp. OS52]MCC2593855.1 ABC transporter ATP-binding protein/permease [Tessaracoccus sp. OS52]